MRVSRRGPQLAVKDSSARLRFSLSKGRQTRLASKQTDATEAKVRDLEMPSRVDKQIVRFEIAVKWQVSAAGRRTVRSSLPMNDASRVQLVETHDDLCQVLARPLDANVAELLDQCREVAATEILHHEIEVVAALERVV